MCSKGNVFDTNIRKFDAKKHFCPECLGFVNHEEKFILFEDKISALDAELQLKIKSI